jgi:hypothetical protein
VTICVGLWRTTCEHHSFVKLATILDGYNRVVLVFAVVYKENIDNHKSMPLADPDTVPAEVDGDTGGFDVRRYRERPDVTCRALSGLVSLWRARGRPGAVATWVFLSGFRSCLFGFARSQPGEYLIQEVLCLRSNIFIGLLTGSANI